MDTECYQPKDYIYTINILNSQTPANFFWFHIYSNMCLKSWKLNCTLPIKISKYFSIHEPFFEQVHVLACRLRNTNEIISNRKLNNQIINIIEKKSFN